MSSYLEVSCRFDENSFANVPQACQPETPEKEKSLLLALARTLLERKPSSPFDNADTLLLYTKILREIGGDAIIEALGILTPDRAQKDDEDKANKDACQKWMTDLRLRWERWELVDEVAKGPSEGDWNWEEEYSRASDLISIGDAP